ncbi:MAG TPA: hypothetical protein VGE07_30745, partial [Herpetosiphonaceae bacterium]
APPAEDKAARLAAIRAANAQKAQASPAQVKPAAARPAPAAVAAPADNDEPAMAFHSLLLLLLSVVLGAFAAVFVLPRWLPGLSASLLGPEPKAYWFLSRSSAMVAYGLLWLSMALGLSISGKLARIWPGGPTVFDMHQHASLLGLAFGLFHGLILMGDSYINYSLMQVLVPFRSGAYRPLWVGLGQLALYGLALVGLSFYARPLIGRRAWRLIHFLSFLVFALALFHGVKSGTDTQHAWARAFYWATGGSLIFLTIYRILITATNKRPAPARA